MTKTFSPDPYARADARARKKKRQQQQHNNERAAMEKRAQARISFGTWTFFSAPKPTSKVGDFTVAFPEAIKRSDLYKALADALGDSWGSTQSIRITLVNPPEWRVTRARIRNALEKLLIKTKEEEGS